MIQVGEGGNERMEDKLVMSGPVVLVRGAGELASGVGWALAKARFRVVMTEVAKPLMVRWPVCFGTAVAEGKWQVEGIPARRVEDPRACEGVWTAGEIPAHNTSSKLVSRENFNLLNSYPITKWCGGKVHKLNDSVYHLMRLFKRGRRYK